MRCNERVSPRCTPDQASWSTRISPTSRRISLTSCTVSSTRDPPPCRHLRTCQCRQLPSTSRCNSNSFSTSSSCSSRVIETRAKPFLISIPARSPHPSKCSLAEAAKSSTELRQLSICRRCWRISSTATGWLSVAKVSRIGKLKSCSAVGAKKTWGMPGVAKSRPRAPTTYDSRRAEESYPTTSANLKQCKG